ncbi:ORC1-type DNA replication protein [Candidatus Woesearchaeota archaeon]|nr:ORC1-type DNA replication protein [Candidatus Woesearchaeota archaeon]
MNEKGLVDFFEKYLTKKPLFKNKKALQSNFIPGQIFHREDQIKTVANILAPCLRGDRSSNIFIYGKTGTGKTLTIRHITEQLQKTAQERELPLKVIYLNCKLKKVADTEYRLFAQLIREFGKNIPSTGLPTDDVYTMFYNILDKEKIMLLLILDEIDQLVGKAGDEILYNITRINTELRKSQIVIVGISNDLIFTDTLDPRVKSSLSEEEIVFPPYNALQIQEILKDRSQQAFYPKAIQAGVIEKCAAYAAREHGDARRALELLRVAGELAERNENEQVKIENIDQAENKIEKDRILDLVKTQPQQHQTALYSIYKVCEQKDKHIFTGEVYEIYQKLCNQIGIRPLTQRRVSDIIAEFDMLGIINAKIISKGRYGRTREISLSTTEALKPKIKKILEEELGLA